jgi:PE-PPE domain
MGNAKYAATRMTVSIGVAALAVAATVAPTPPVSTVSPAVKLSADSTALVLGGTSIPTWNDADVEVIMDQFIAPTHPTAPGETITPVAVTTPEELWPGGRWVGPLVCLALCPTSVFGPGGSGWLPDEPLWKLSGLFSRTFDQSVQDGVADLEAAMADHGNDDLVIYGYSQGAVVANVEKRKLAQQYPKGTTAGTTAPDIDFVLGFDPNLPNGGFLARFPGLYIPILNFSFNGPAPTHTQFDTVEIIHEYDFMADFPLYPLNGISLLNAVLGFVYVHLYPFDVSLAPDPTKPPPMKSQHGDTDYYFFPTEDLPLFGPLRTLGVPEPVIDVVEPFFKVIVDLGYDRSIDPWEPTPARLIPPLNPAAVAGDLVNAVGEGITNAAALIGAPKPLTSPAPPASEDGDAVVELARVGPAPEKSPAVGSPPPEPVDIQGHVEADPGKVGQKLPAFMHRINESIGAVKSVIGNGRTIVKSSGDDNGSPTSIAGPARKAPARDAFKDVRSDVKKVMTKLSDSIKKALSGGKDDDIKDGGEDASP